MVSGLKVGAEGRSAKVIFPVTAPLRFGEVVYGLLCQTEGTTSRLWQPSFPPENLDNWATEDLPLQVSGTSGCLLCPLVL